MIGSYDQSKYRAINLIVWVKVSRISFPVVRKQLKHKQGKI